jgi:hypothetical protein
MPIVRYPPKRGTVRVNQGRRQTKKHDYKGPDFIKSLIWVNDKSFLGPCFSFD